MFCKAKTSVTSWWSLNSENNEMTAAIKKTQPQQMRPTHSLSKTLVKKSVVHMPAGETGHKAPPTCCHARMCAWFYSVYG